VNRQNLRATFKKQVAFNCYLQTRFELHSFTFRPQGLLLHHLSTPHRTCISGPQQRHSERSAHFSSTQVALSALSTDVPRTLPKPVTHIWCYFKYEQGRNTMADNSKEQELAAHGWTAVPRSQSKIIADLEDPKPANIVVEDIQVPDSDVARKTYEYAKKELPEKTFNHSMRVYYYGTYALYLVVILHCQIGHVGCRTLCCCLSITETMSLEFPSHFAWRRMAGPFENILRIRMLPKDPELTQHRCGYCKISLSPMDSVLRDLLLDLPSSRHRHDGYQSQWNAHVL
jgi:hypothetical protein